MKEDALVKESYSMDKFLSSKAEINKPDYDKLTVIIPYRYSENNPEDIENLNLILNYLKFIGVNHIIISEEDEYSKADDLLSALDIIFDDLQVLFTRSITSFNKVIAINNAVKKCSTPYVAIMDYKILVPKESFDRALSLVDSFYDFVYASNDYFKKIDNKINLMQNFDFEKINAKEEYSLRYSNILLCKKECLMNIGAYNPLFKNDCFLDMEVLLRIIVSEYDLFYVNDYSYHLNYSEVLSDEDLNIFVSQYNLTKFNDINVLINHNLDLYSNSHIFDKKDYKEIPPEYLISVIIPIYNCESFYIDRCINSLRNQTLGFENIEVIFVDDGSIYPSSVKILKKYVEEYENVKLISLDLNSGPGIARNAGILEASAKYITFLDYDDYFVNDICEVYYENMDKEDIDVLITNPIDFTLNSPKLENWDFLNFRQNEITIKNFSENADIFNLSSLIGSRAYRKDFLINNQLSFLDYRIYENLLFNEQTLFEAKGIKLINVASIVHGYRNNTNENFKSNSLKYNFNLLMDSIKSLNECYRLYLKYGIEIIIKENFKNIVEKWIVDCFFKNLLTKDEIRIVVNECYPLFIHFDGSFSANVFNELSKEIISRNYGGVYSIHEKNYQK